VKAGDNGSVRVLAGGFMGQVLAAIVRAVLGRIHWPQICLFIEWRKEV